MIKNSIDIIIPTMWKMKEFPNWLEKYTQSDCIGNIYVIDNDHINRPIHNSFQHPKIQLISFNRNIYVNPAWNEGYYRSKADILCILNDDISVDNSLFDYIQTLDFAQIDIIGVHLRGSIDNYHIVHHPDREEKLIKLNVDRSTPIGGQSYAFGVCMFIKRSSYKVIPSLYQIWYGDDYLIQNCENVYALKTSKITGEISKTIVAFDKTTEVHKRISLDSSNAFKYNHFLNVEKWDLVNQYRKSNNQLSNKSNKENIDLFEKEYQLAVKTPSDINQNLQLLHQLAKKCHHITEFGVRTGCSTRAFLNTDCVLRSYDIVIDNQVDQLFNIAKSRGRDVKYIKNDVLTIDIDETDLLFIDTFHVYPQLKKELALHAKKVKKYIAFHDTYTFGLTGEHSSDKKGLLTAIIEFLIENPEWRFKTFETKNNGITILEKTI